jgi:hypothetical protein
MKTPEDEAFDDLARKQGAWGGGYQAKRQAAMDKVNAEFDEEYIKYRTAFPKGYTTQQVLPKDYTTQQRVPLVDIEYTLSVADIKKDLAQPAQEPVAWMYDWLCDGKLITGWIAHNEAEIPKLVASNIRPLYTAPPKREWAGLTDDERNKILMSHKPSWERCIAEEIEAKLKEKNT